jgi:hypothetical protein
MAYIGTSDLMGENIYYENFAEYLYGTNGTLGTDGASSLATDIEHWYNIINDELRSTGRFSVLPIQKDDNGNYPQSVKDWNAYLLVYHKLLSRFTGEQEEVPETIQVYGRFATRNAGIVKTGGAIFHDEIDVGELGIGEPVVSGNLGSNTLGTFYNNWRGYPYGEKGYGYLESAPDRLTFGRSNTSKIYRGFSGYDYPRIWAVQIDLAGGVGTSTFKWSKNAGMSWEDTGVLTDEDWIYLEENVYVRWGPDKTGTHHFSLNDKWTFQTVPQDIRRTYSNTEAKVNHTGRGW